MKNKVTIDRDFTNVDSFVKKLIKAYPSEHCTRTFYDVA